jgi:hypothetical protein
MPTLKPLSSPERFGARSKGQPTHGSRRVLVLAAAFVIAVLVWQGIATKGSPDPMEAHGSKAVAIFDIGVLV